VPSKGVMIGVVVVCVAIAGFAAGGFAGAYMAGEPGSEYDPLVAESYLQEAVAQAKEELQAEIVALQEEIEALRKKVDALERKASSPATGSRSQSSQGSQGSQAAASSGAGSQQPSSGNQGSEIAGIPKEPGRTAVVKAASGANLRTGPGTDYEAVTAVANQTRVELIATMDGWYEVKLADGTKGWIFGELIELD